MARYNSISSTSSVAGGSTISTPASGLLTTLTGTGTVTIPNPVLYTGQTQTFYNSTGSAITLSTPSGNFIAPGIASASSISIPAGSIFTAISDGTNYLAQDWLGGVVSTANLVATGGTINGINIGATTTGTGAFSTLNVTSTTTLAGMSATTGAFSGISTFTNSAAVTLGSTSTGALQVTAGGASVTGGLYVGGQSSFGNSVGVGTNSPNYAVSIGNGGSIGLQTASNTYSRLLATPSQWGYSAGYRTIILGSTSSTYTTDITGAVTLAFGVDVSGNNNGSFSGDGRELIFRNVTSFVTPNSGNTGYLTPLAFNNGNVAIGSGTAAVSLDLSARTDAILLPKGTTAQRPASPVAGMTRFNTDAGTTTLEVYNGSSWLLLKAQFVATSTGTVTTSGSYIIHTFTSSGSFTVSTGSTSAELLIVAGGGGTGFDVGGGGGGGGVVYYSSFGVSAGTYNVTVGTGGSSAQSGGASSGNGTNSSFGAATVAIGGGGGGTYPSGQTNGQNGGSGGGAGNQNASGGSGTAGQGNGGGTSTSPWGSGAGGGAGGAGPNGVLNSQVAGGAPVYYSISGTSVAYAGGGYGNSDGGTIYPTGQNTAGTTIGYYGFGANGTGAPNNSSYTGNPGIVIIRYLQ